MQIAIQFHNNVPVVQSTIFNLSGSWRSILLNYRLSACPEQVKVEPDK